MPAVPPPVPPPGGAGADRRAASPNAKRKPRKGSPSPGKARKTGVAVLSTPPHFSPPSGHAGASGAPPDGHTSASGAPKPPKPPKPPMRSPNAKRKPRKAAAQAAAEEPGLAAAVAAVFLDDDEAVATASPKASPKASPSASPNVSPSKPKKANRSPVRPRRSALKDDYERYQREQEEIEYRFALERQREAARQAEFAEAERFVQAHVSSVHTVINEEVRVAATRDKANADFAEMQSAPRHSRPALLPPQNRFPALREGTNGVLHAVCCTQCAACGVLQAPCCVLRAVCCALCAARCVLCAVCCALCATRRTNAVCDLARSSRWWCSWHD